MKDDFKHYEITNNVNYTINRSEHWAPGGSRYPAFVKDNTADIWLHVMTLSYFAARYRAVPSGADCPIHTDAVPRGGLPYFAARHRTAPLFYVWILLFSKNVFRSHHTDTLFVILILMNFSYILVMSCEEKPLKTLGEIVRPPPLKFEVERTSFSSRRNQKPLEYNFNYFRPSFDISFPENVINTATISTTNDSHNISPNNTDRCRSLTPKKPLKDSNFRISPNSAFTPISLPTKKIGLKKLDSSKSFDEVARNSELFFRSKNGIDDGRFAEISFAPVSMKTATKQQSTTTKSTKRSSSSRGNNKDMPDRETNMEYALNINPSLSKEDHYRHPTVNDMSPGDRHYDMAMERAKIKPVVYQHKWSMTPEYLEDPDMASHVTGHMVSRQYLKIIRTVRLFVQKTEPKASIIESTENEKVSRIDENRRKNSTISTSLYVGDTDIENKQNFWHKVFKFEQKSDSLINDEKKFIISHNKFPFTQHQRGQQIAVVDDHENHHDQEHYRRKYTPSKNPLGKMQKHKTICIFPEREETTENIDIISPKFNEKTLNDDDRTEQVEKSTSIDRILSYGEKTYKE
uniref:Uncharacterized protein n=1 Tax=Romanomermis culicivorax TaxID=13658 RepID=A0A915HL78_ROMCU